MDPQARNFIRQGNDALANNDRTLARVRYRQSINVQETAEAWILLAKVIDNIHAAIRFCQRAVELEPGLANAWSDLAAYKSEEGEYTYARWAINKAKNCHRSLPDAEHFIYMNAARLAILGGQYEQAFYDLQTAYALCPEDSRIPVLMEHAGNMAATAAAA